ncbi:MAG: hypothetical protein ABIS29_09180 [Vicinamibacterales bacterium]
MTEDHRTAILHHLRGRLIDVDKAQRTGSLIVLDAQRTLGREDRILIRAYGEMVDVLWKNGKSDAAIRLEMLWNKLAQCYGFALLCGYSMGNFYKETKGFEAVCRAHTHVVAPLAEPAAAQKRRTN